MKSSKQIIFTPASLTEEMPIDLSHSLSAHKWLLSVGRSPSARRPRNFDSNFVHDTNSVEMNTICSFNETGVYLY